MQRKRRGAGRAYRQGITLVQIIEMFPDDDDARRWLESHLWPDGARCPRCRSANVTEVRGHRSQTHRCRDCSGRPLFSLRTGTVMAGSNLGYRVWAIGIYLFCTNLKGTSSLHLHRDLGITQSAAWHLGHRLREAWTDRDREAFGGPVEFDETALGGKRRWMHADRRRDLLEKHGRGSGSMTTVAGARDRETGRIHARVVPSVDGATLQGFVHEVTDPDAVVYTDEAGGYRGVDRRHETVNHSIGQFVDGQASVNGLESFWSTLKRGYHGTFHHFTSKHMDRYLVEFAERHGRREADTAVMMGDLAAGMTGKRLRWTDLVGEERVADQRRRLREAKVTTLRPRRKRTPSSTATGTYRMAASPDSS